MLSGARRPRILLLDPLEAARRRLEALIGGLPVEARCLQAESLEQATRLLASAPIRVVISRFRLPGATTREIVDALRGIRPGVGIVVYSSFATLEFRRAAASAGAALALDLNASHLPLSSYLSRVVATAATVAGERAEPSSRGPLSPGG